MKCLSAKVLDDRRFQFWKVKIKVSGSSRRLSVRRRCVVAEMLKTLSRTGRTRGPVILVTSAKSAVSICRSSLFFCEPLLWSWMGRSAGLSGGNCWRLIFLRRIVQRWKSRFLWQQRVGEKMDERLSSSCRWRLPKALYRIRTEWAKFQSAKLMTTSSPLSN